MCVVTAFGELTEKAWREAGNLRACNAVELADADDDQVE